ncbi:MAG: rhomboid family intramembrane serine protease [bacterium]|nr:rhomboid family intramembrane serine protease [bacterium]MCY4257512.1 rhomboid family intramembrane serine protease [bacterium]
MEPISRDNWCITYVLIGANALVFMVSVAMGDTLTGGIANDGLIVEAATWGVAIDVNGEWWRIFTGGFLHHGAFHLGVNMMSLYILGFPLERGLGRVSFLTVYCAALLGGSFGALLETPNALVAGASGAIFGLMGAWVVLSLAQGISIFSTLIGPMVAVNLAISFTVDQVSLGGHLGGLIAGSLVALSAAARGRYPKITEVVPLITGLLVGVGSVFGALWAAGGWVNA